MVQKSADKGGNQLATYCPTSTKITKDPSEIGNTSEHHSAIGNRLAEVDGRSIFGKRDVSQDRQVEARRRDDDVSLKLFARFQQDALFSEVIDMIGDDAGLATCDALEQGGRPGQQRLTPGMKRQWLRTGTMNSHD